MSPLLRGPAARRAGAQPTAARTAAAATAALPPAPTQTTALTHHGRTIVRITPPSGTGTFGRYWRVTPASGLSLRRTTAASWPQAWEKGQRLLAQAVSGAGTRPETSLATAIERYLAAHPTRTTSTPGPRQSPRAPRPWSPRYARAQRERLTRLAAAIGKVPCGQLTAVDLENFLAHLPSFNAELEMTKTLTTLTRWLEARQYALPIQGLHVRMAGYELSRTNPGGRLGEHAPAPQTGEHPLLIQAEAIPDHAQVHAAAAAMPATTRSGRRLWELEVLILVAAYAGPRLGELLAATCDDVLAAGELLHIAGQTSEVPGLVGTVPTKGARRRTVPVIAVTPLGYPLAAQLHRRAKQAQAERAAGTNPDGLLFPCTDGRHPWRQSNLRNRYFNRAIGASGANWPSVDVCGRRRSVWTFHSLRHHAATFLLRDVHADSGRTTEVGEVALVLGHADQSTTSRFYVERTAEALQNIRTALADTAARHPDYTPKAPGERPAAQPAAVPVAQPVTQPAARAKPLRR